ncbi:uncharacterized protein [Centruroides vittatus]|uniref:uncharacterized protein n=1 Tax=Centruroides vittatus TaxID=120091 RepID=UPI00350F5496
MAHNGTPSVDPNEWPLVHSLPWPDQTLNIFTDGSKNDDDEVGCAFVAFQGNTEVYNFSDGLGNTCSAYQVELWAILSAIKWCNIMFNLNNINIFTDSCSSVQAISNYNWHHPLVNSILLELHKSNNRFAVVWIRGHSGVVGNERADELACLAATSCVDPTYKATPQSYMIQGFKEDARDKWQRSWNTQTNSLTRDFFPLVSTSVKRDIEHCLTQFYTKHGKFYQYLHRFRLTNQQNTDSARHYLLECPMQTRVTALLPRDSGWPPNLSVLIQDGNLFQATKDLIKTYFRRTTVTQPHPGFVV